MTPPPFSRYIAYVDEAGDHGPVSPEFPVFVLAFCIFEKDAYAREVTTAISRLKFEFFGHDALVLHERDIRKEQGPFTTLRHRERRGAFVQAVTRLVTEAPFVLIAAVIDKQRLREKVAEPGNVYHLAVRSGLERIGAFLEENGDEGEMPIVFESRGHQEDRALEAAFGRVCADNASGRPLPLRLLFASKSATHAGLEIADLVARPIGVHCMRPTQANRAYDVIATKFRRDAGGEHRGAGLACFP